MAATKVELFDRIRHDSWREGLSVRALARKCGVHRRLVREALVHPVDPRLDEAVIGAARTEQACCDRAQLVQAAAFSHGSRGS